MPTRCHQSPPQQLHHSHHHRQQSPHRPLLTSSSRLPSVLLSAGCCAVIFLASAIAGFDNHPVQRMTPSEMFARAKGEQPQGDGPAPEGRHKGGPRISTRTPQEQRKAKQEEIMRQIKMVILNVTGMDDGPLNKSAGKDPLTTLPGKDPEVWHGGSNSVGGYGPSKGEGQGPPAAQGNNIRPTEITSKIKEFADEVPNLTGVDGAVQFVLHPKQTPGYNGSQRVINATMKVLVRLTRHTLQPPKPKARRRRITIVAYLLDDEDPGRQKVVTTDPYLPIAQLTVLVRKTNWHKVLLPTTIVQRVLDSSDKVLRLRVLCLECNDETEVVMTPRRSRNKKTGRKSLRTGRPSGGGGGSGEGHRHPVDKSLLDASESSTNRKSLHLVPPVGGGDGESKRSPVLIVSTKSSSRFRKTA